MELEPLFTEQKWGILQNLSRQSYSPLQLAEQSNTSIANISQQLRLLEAASLVKKQKIPNRDKGKPRTLFSLKKSYAYVISTMDGFADKKLIEVENHNEAMIKIMFLEDKEDQISLMRLYWKIEDNIDHVKLLGYRKNGNGKELAVIADDKKTIERIEKSAGDYKIEFYRSIEDVRSRDYFVFYNAS